MIALKPGPVRLAWPKPSVLAACDSRAQRVECDRRGRGDVERVDARGERDAHPDVGLGEHRGRQARPLRAEQEREALVAGGGDLGDVDRSRLRRQRGEEKPASRSGARPAGSGSVRACGRLSASPIEIRSERR